jgi:LysR family transcriptional regulator for bpeEF and oprC
MPKNRRGNAWAMALSDASGEHDYPINPILVANDPAALKGALLCGEGLMLGADVMVKPYLEQGHLQRVLAGWTGPEYEFNAVFPRGHVQSPKVRAFVDFLVERMTFDVDYMMEHCPVYLKQQAEARAAAEATPEVEAAAAVGRKVLADVLS